MKFASFLQKISIFTALTLFIHISYADTSKATPMSSQVERVSQTLENNESFRKNVTALYKKLISKKQIQVAQVDFHAAEILVVPKETANDSRKVLLHFIDVKKHLDVNNSILHRYVIESDLELALPENSSSTDIEESIKDSSLELSNVQSSTSQLRLKKQ